MGDRRTEHGHYGIADKLLHGSTESLDPFPCSHVVSLQRVPDVLGIRLFGLARETDEVHEEHRNQFAFLPGRLGFHRRAACEAEPSSRWVLLTAAPASHRRSVPRVG